MNYEHYSQRTGPLFTSQKTLICLLLCCSGIGCHRAYYRDQADVEAYEIIDEKVAHSGENVSEPLRIIPDRRSRMHNPFDPNHQPMPVDDPVSHRYMACVDGRPGYPLWHANGQTNLTESPDWLHFLPLTEEGVLVLDADMAVRLSLLHSPEYQRQLEQLYLSALDVSSERFRFETQFFGGAQAFYSADGPDRTGLGGDSSSTLTVGPFSSGQRDLSMQRSFATGADLVVGLANSIVWELSGPNLQGATTVLDFALVQPLLRAAGRDRILERLTRAERILLANVRAFERFRRSFYLNIITGRSTEANVRRSGGLLGVGLEGFTGLGGGFGGLANGIAGTFSVETGVVQAGGYLGLLQDQVQIQNLEENVARLQENLLVLKEGLTEQLTIIPTDPAAIPQQRLQIAQARQALLNAQRSLLGRRSEFQRTLDRFLSRLGLPPYITTRIQDPMLRQFELVDNILRGRRETLTELRLQSGQANVALLEFSTDSIDSTSGLPIRRIRWSPELAGAVATLRQQLRPLQKICEMLVDQDLDRVVQDIKQLEESLPGRAKHVTSLHALYQSEKENVDTLLGSPTVSSQIFDYQRVEQLNRSLKDEFDQMAERLATYSARIEKLNKTLNRFSEPIKPADIDDVQLAKIIYKNLVLASQDLLANLSDDVLELLLIQTQARTESILLPRVLLTPRQAFDVAKDNRRDWANARASLVDAWRAIEFIADDLESSLDVTFSGDLQNATDNPFDLRASTGRLRVGLQWDAPLTRLQERNTYRQALIDFERARRSYYQFEDDIWTLMRGQIRQLRANQINFEIGRQSVRSAAEQLMLNEDLRKLREARGLSSGPTAARDAISALSDLLDAQNTLLDIGVNYEVIRRGLDFDLGTMQLTAEGYWLDPGEIDFGNVLDTKTL